MFPSTHILLPILTLFSLLHAHPTSPSPSPPPSLQPPTTPSSISSSSPLHPRANTLACPSTTLHTPTVSEWTWALETYCTRHTPFTITRSTPLTYTYQLTAYDGKPIKWLFKVWIDGNIYPSLGQGEDKTRYTLELSKEVCEERFRAMVTGEEGGGRGGMLKGVCEVEGKGDKLFRGAIYRELLVKGYIGEVVWETRQVKGD